MSGKTLQPLPAPPSGNAPLEYPPAPRFRTSLPAAGPDPHRKWYPPLVVIPPAPASTGDHPEDFARSWPKPLAALPAEERRPAVNRQPELLPEIVLPSIKVPVAEEARPEHPFLRKLQEQPEPEGKPDFTAPPQAEEPEPVFKAVPPLEKPLPDASPHVFQAAPPDPAPAAAGGGGDFTDNDLAEAFAPIIDAAVRKAVYKSEESNISAILEPMLRATVRRALAEYSPAARPFQPPGFFDRTAWRLQALFSSRTYEEVLFEKTHRFQVDEVYLLDAESLALVSFASCDPARHTAAKRVEGSAQRIAVQLREEDGGIRRAFTRSDGRHVIAESGDYAVLVAIVRGEPNELILADLSFALHRIEDHFRERFEEAGSALMHALQPFLEDCLLIQAPASAA